MDAMRICSGCQKPIAPNAPDGLCPKCLGKAGLGTGVEIGPDSEVESGQTRFVAPTADELVKPFPQLEILGFIGQGGMGAVYKARQKALDRIVALKILPPGIGGDPSFTQRFTREAKALAKLNHPGIVTLYEFGQADGLFFFLMEFVDGVNLRQLLNAGRIAPKEALAIVPQICEALQFAHDRGIVHRDIKPENILLSKDGQVKIADFGVAKIVARASSSPTQPTCPETVITDTGGTPVVQSTQTEPGVVLGTPQYMAPEQVSNPLEVDHRADIYSLGVVFYQMLTGELPTGKFEPPSKKVVIDVRLDEVVLRALEKEPARRYQQAREVQTMVEIIATTPPPRNASAPTPPAGDLPLFVERAGRRQLYWPGVLLFCGTLGLVVGGCTLAIALAFWLLNTPVRLTFHSGEVLLVLMLMAACAVMRVAALKLGSREAARTGATKAGKVSMSRKVLVGFLAMTVSAVMAAGVVFFASLFRAVSTTALPDGNSRANIARVAVWIAISVAAGLFIIRRVRRAVNKPSCGGGQPEPQQCESGNGARLGR